ncbi:hypothetical protein OPKNFCMD_5027 [Methylobacterium crusticola]|uniref:Thioredoxin domain-containing protein n=1 Tax=Methylobacterium crusticola TaxID=1697972 RepID=A0ABQ4R637_9HYPH|nr:DsbA family protein [Methylobacterium crusticola]GJD52264.1 hypothetical protein OPKNFCMD_5027 [Methylobacterium crusticola]
MLPLPRLLPALALTGFVALAAAPTRAEAPLTDAQRQAVEGIIREYLVKNPEVLQDAMAELERRTQEAQKQAQASALKETRDVLHNSPHGIVAGNPGGDVTLVEFFDYNCGYCKRALTDIQTIMKSDPKLKVVLKDFPVLGPDSLEASKVALAVKQQLKGDKLFDYHVKLLETRGRVNGERAISLAREMGADVARLQKDMQSPEIQAALQENVGLGDKLGLSGTPAFIIGDEIIPGAVGIEPIRKTVAGVRQCGHAAC